MKTTLGQWQQNFLAHTHTSHIRFALVAAFLSLVSLPVQAYGYSMNHEYYSRSRSPIGSNVYLSQQAFYNRSSLFNESGKWAPSELKGYSLTTSAGLEHFRFLQTGLFYSNANLKGRSDDGLLMNLEGHEFGVEGRVVLSSPVVNVGLGGGAYLTKKDHVFGLERQGLQGSGYKAGLDFGYFLSPRVSLLFSGFQHQEKISRKEGAKETSRNEVKSVRLGGGIALWL
jgi:hypothetical protein